MRKTIPSNPSEKGFTLIEMLLVLVIIALLASIAIPSLLKTKEAAEAGSTTGTMRAIQANQSNYYFQNGRYASITELNTYSDNALGTNSGSTMWRGNYRYYSFPLSANGLKTQYTILAIRFKNNTPVSALIMRQDGVVQTLF